MIKLIKKNKITFLLLLIIFNICFCINCFCAEDNNSFSSTGFENMKVKSEIYEKMSSDDKSAIESFKSLTLALSELQIADAFNYVYDSNNQNYDRFNDFFNEYPDSKDVIKKYFSQIDYKIIDYITENSIITFNTNVSIIDPQQLIKKAAPKFLTKNFLSLMKGKDGINNKVINSLITCIGDVLNKNNTESINFNYKFQFKKDNNTYKLSNLNSIFFDIENYVKNIYSQILSKNK